LNHSFNIFLFNIYLRTLFITSFITIFAIKYVFILLLFKLLFNVEALNNAPQQFNTRSVMIDDENTYVEYGVPYPFWRGAGNSCRTCLLVRLCVRVRVRVCVCVFVNVCVNHISSIQVVLHF